MKEFGFIGEEWKPPILLQQPKQRAHNPHLTQQPQFTENFAKHSEIQHFENFLKTNLNYSIQKGGGKAKKVIILDDLPNLSHDTILSKLNNILKSICNANYLVPIVICFNENQNQSLRRTFNTQLLAHAKVSLLKLNKVAPTLLTKSLKRVVELEFGLIQRKNATLHDLITKLVKTEVGDMRSLLNSFQFYSLNWENVDFGSLFEK
jgi:hypothetical protein